MKTTLLNSLKSTLSGVIFFGFFTANSQSISDTSINHAGARVHTIGLSVFSAVPAEGQVNITWATASEIDNDYFLVERSVNGLDWEAMTILDGAGNSGDTHYYNCVDASPFAEDIFYYRLKQIQFNGDYSYSDILSVEMENKSTKIQLYPNPAVSYIKITPDSKTEQYTVSLYNGAGRLVKHITGDVNTMLIDVMDLETGRYFAVIDSGTKIEKVQFVKN